MKNILQKIWPHFWRQLQKSSLVTGFACLIVTGLCVSSISNGYAAETETANTSPLKQVMHNMQDRYDAMQSLTAFFHQELRHRDSGANQVNEGLLQWRKPLLVRWEVVGMNAELFIVEPSSIWNYFPDEELAYRYPLDLVENSMAIINVVTGQSQLEEDFSVVDEGLEQLEDGRTVARLHLYPHEPAQNFTEAILWLDMKSYLIERILIYDFYGNENDVTFSQLMPDASVSDAAIIFVPPAGTEIIDQR